MAMRIVAPKKLPFPGSKDAYNMLRRGAQRGALRNFNEAVGEELIDLGFAAIQGAELVVTDAGRQILLTHAYREPSVCWP
jgi:hypothetical protein